ncbi:ATP-binding protein [Enterocloster bolteae]|uniref:ATP-binding protein n=1 Tax=Enterocloster bolteae TaxID=208479 RepID=UPI002A7FFE25|nr:ATP-binding protein [Enterocloster bolteae]
MTAENLMNLLDSLTETSVYVIEEESHRLLYFNERCRNTGRGRAALGIRCDEVWPELCANCPLKMLGDRVSNHMVCYDPLLKLTVDVTANRINWEGRVPAVVITAAPHRLNFEEEQGFQKIRQMYASSLVTVFDECIIANLTRDYYVSCQKDVVWDDIPEQGNFGSENRKYAQKALHPDDLECFNENFSRESMLCMFTEGKKQITRRLRRRADNGSYRTVEFTAARIGNQEDECWCVLVFRDVQDELLLEQERNVEISQLATAAKAAYQMLIAVNLTQNTYHMVEYQRFPVKEPDPEGRFDELIEFEMEAVHPDYREEFRSKFTRKALTEAFQRGECILSMDVPHIGEDGIYHWNSTQVVKVESPYTHDLIEITLSRNIDEERRVQQETLEKERQAKLLLEDALKKAEKANKAKSDFLSRMSHDIRTPMNAIIEMTELAQLHIGDEEKQRDYLNKIASSGAHLLGLINEILDVSKIESGVMELSESPLNLRALAGEAAEMVRISMENSQQEFQVDIDESFDPWVMGDARRIRQVLVNILENASKYTGQRGKITFSVCEFKKEEQRTGTYRFIIEDTGIGMKPEYMEHIFEPFSRADDSRTSKVPGTGLGMTIVKNLISMMDGDIRVESEYGKGSRFTVTLCLDKCGNTGEAIQPAVSGPEAACRGLRVLLVEDNELNRQIASEMLKLLGVRVEMAENGREAVEAVCSHPALYYDAVFMDVQMPVMNGYEATREIRGSGMERIGELPIIAMTADAFAEDVKRARLSGMNGHLAKPVSIELLRGALSGCLDCKRKNRWDEMMDISGPN